jgi:dipeptidyl aminopeptidase/acylaminoacyl peptidase
MGRCAGFAALMIATVLSLGAPAEATFPGTARELAATGREVCLAKDCSSVGVPAWSPDGRRVAFATRAPGEVATWVVVADARDGSHVTRVFGRTGATADDVEWQYLSPAWRPGRANNGRQ